MNLRTRVSSLIDQLRGRNTTDRSTIQSYDPIPEDMLSFTVPSGVEAVEQYWAKRPYSLISIRYDDADAAYQYHVIEPELNAFEHQLLDLILPDLRDVLIHRDEEWDYETIPGTELFEQAMLDLVEEYGIDVPPALFYRVYYYVWRTFSGFGKLDALMRDPYIEDIWCDGYDLPLYLYHERYQNIRSTVSYQKDELDSFVIRLAQEAGKNISLEKPYVGGTLSDGSRIELSYGDEVTRRGSTFTIRKFAADPYTPIDLVSRGTFSVEQMAYFWMAIEHNKSLIFAGGTASGKTTSLNAISMFIPPRSKVLSIEDTPEINLFHENWIPAVTRSGPDIESEIDMFTLLRSGLRQRPEYIIVGEVRGEEALTLFQAMNTGHTTYSTIHAESIGTVVRRLENPPINVPRAMLEALDVISVQLLTRVGEDRVRRTDALVEIAGIDDRSGDINFIELFEWRPDTDEVEQTGNSSVLREIAQERGIAVSDVRVELRKRQRVLQYLLDQDISGYREFTKIVHEYYASPERVLNRIPEGSVENA